MVSECHLDFCSSVCTASAEHVDVHMCGSDQCSERSKYNVTIATAKTVLFMWCCRTQNKPSPSWLEVPCLQERVDYILCLFTQSLLIATPSGTAAYVMNCHTGQKPSAGCCQMADRVSQCASSTMALQVLHAQRGAKRLQVGGRDMDMHKFLHTKPGYT